MKLTLETERLLLRPYERDDAEAMFHGWAGDPEVSRFVTWNAHKDVEETQRVIDRWIEEYEKPERLNFGIVVKDEGKLVGSIDVVGYLGGVDGTPVIGYCLSRAYHNRGYMTEACRCVTDYLFSQGYEEIRIDAMAENPASIRVIKKCGGEYIGSQDEYFKTKDRTITIEQYIVRRR